MSMKEEKFSLPPEILEAMELTDESNYTPEQLLAYDKYLDAIRTEEMFREDAEEREAQREAQGEAREKAKWEDKIKKTVQKLKKSGHFTNEEIAETMGLSVSEVEML